MLKKLLILSGVLVYTNMQAQIQMLDFNIENLPSQCVYEGNITKAYHFADKNGNNYVLFCEKKTLVADEFQQFVSKEIKVYHYKNSGANQCILLRRFNDFQKDCIFGNMLNIVADTITDIDNNGFAELIFMYTNTCQSDASPMPLKLMFTENGNKFAYRGYNKMGSMGGEISDFRDFERAPDYFKTFCKDFWEKHCSKW